MTFFGWVFVLISLGSQAPHVRCTPMGVHRTCGEPNEIESTLVGGQIERLRARTPTPGRLLISTDSTTWPSALKGSAPPMSTALTALGRDTSDT